MNHFISPFKFLIKGVYERSSTPIFHVIGSVDPS